jgi:hypothetical protein
MMRILAWNGALGAMLKIATIMMVAILDITGITTAQEEAAPILQVVLKTVATNTTEIPMLIVQEEPVILLLLVAMNVHPLALLNISVQVL